jgi:putative N6-adenine-specific DNA methylase
LLIEATLIARNIAPGVYRKGFAFEKWANFDENLWEEVYNDDSREREFKHKIYGSDAGYYAAQVAQKNIQSPGLQRDIEVRQVRIQELKAENGKLNGCDVDGALVMINPPYGERLSQDKDVLRLYQDMGTALKHQFSGATAWVISSNEDALKCIGLRPAKKIHLVNGDLECLFNKYELFKGDRKTWKKSL